MAKHVVSDENNRRGNIDDSDIDHESFGEEIIDETLPGAGKVPVAPGSEQKSDSVAEQYTSDVFDSDSESNRQRTKLLQNFETSTKALL